MRRPGEFNSCLKPFLVISITLLLAVALYFTAHANATLFNACNFMFITTLVVFCLRFDYARDGQIIRAYCAFGVVFIATLAASWMGLIEEDSIKLWVTLIRATGTLFLLPVYISVLHGWTPPVPSDDDLKSTRKFRKLVNAKEEVKETEPAKPPVLTALFTHYAATAVLLAAAAAFYPGPTSSLQWDLDACSVVASVFCVPVLLINLRPIYLRSIVTIILAVTAAAPLLLEYCTGTEDRHSLSLKYVVEGRDMSLSLYSLFFLVLILREERSKRKEAPQLEKTPAPLSLA